MRSNSVWYEQVDTALIQKLKEVLGNIQVDFRSEDDIIEYEKPIIYPRVLITHLGETFDRYRYEDTPVMVGSDENKVYFESSAKPYALNYQIEIQTNFIGDMNSLTLKWSSEFVDWNDLDVIDTGGTPRNIPFKLVLDTKVQQQTIDEQRIFRKTYLYDFKVELDEPKITEKWKVKDITLL